MVRWIPYTYSIGYKNVVIGGKDGFFFIVEIFLSDLPTFEIVGILLEIPMSYWILHFQFDIFELLTRRADWIMASPLY